MFYRIKENKLYDYADYQYEKDCIETDLCTMAEYEEHPNKYMVDDVEIEIDVPEYETIIDEDGNEIQVPIMIEIEETITVIDYDEEGNPIGEHEETITKKVQKTHKETVTVQRLVINPNYEQEEAERREAEFNKAFFNTSLGYIRRSVTMADGSHKDFLSDLLPAIFASVSAGKAVNLYAYDQPPFDEDVTDWTEYQHLVTATPQFINECFDQLGADFAPINKEA